MSVTELEFITNIATWLVIIYPLLFASIGWTLARTFATKTNGESLDDMIEGAGFWGTIGGMTKWFVNKLLHFVHHYWLGAILFYIFTPLGPVNGLWSYPVEVLSWIFLGVFLEDGLYHLRGFFTEIKETTEDSGGIL